MRRTRKNRTRRLLVRRAVLLLAAAGIVAGVVFGMKTGLGIVREAILAVAPASGVSVSAGSVPELSAADPEGEAVQRLRELSAQEPRLAEIVDDCQSYPEALLDMLSRNLDMLDFVLGYPENKGREPAKSIGEMEPGKVPLLLQYDPRWGYTGYGDSIIAVAGCGPTCLSMVAADLTGDYGITPAVVARYAQEKGYYVENVGTSWSLMSEGCAGFGLEAEELSLSRGSLENALAQGRPVICSVGPGDFTTAGHFIVITGESGGQFSVCDPNSRERSGMLWDYDRLASQIRNLWAFSKEEKKQEIFY